MEPVGELVDPLLDLVVGRAMAIGFCLFMAMVIFLAFKGRGAKVPLPISDDEEEEEEDPHANCTGHITLCISANVKGKDL